VDEKPQKISRHEGGVGVLVNRSKTEKEADRGEGTDSCGVTKKKKIFIGVRITENETEDKKRDLLRTWGGRV